MGFERLVTLDILIYGGSLGLEFVALVLLRIREPNLPRSFRVPGGLFGAVMVASFPWPCSAIPFIAVTTSRSWE